MPCLQVCFRLVLLLLTASPGTVSAAGETVEPDAEGMNNARMAQIIQRLDQDAKGKPGYWEFSVEGLRVTVITDESADRMRILVPVVAAGELQDGDLYRLMQANFDSALDARYAIAKEIVWSAFIHPLSLLNDEEFLSGIGQTVNLALTFGKSYSSGALVFGGGDSAQTQRRKLIDRLIDQGSAI